MTSGTSHSRTESESDTDSAPFPYAPIQSSRLYEDVAAQIQGRIIAGELRPGDKLPPEHLLTQEFGVSRTVIREAIHCLRSRGLVVVRHGSGVTVCEPQQTALSELLGTLFQFRGATALDLHHVRELFEIEVAGLAAEKATEEDKVELQRALVWMGEALDRPDQYVVGDLLFHTVLARATQNQVFLLLLESLVDLLRQSRQHAAQAPGGLERSFQGHQAIYHCITRGDPQGAREAMRAHLHEIRERLLAGEPLSL